MPYLGYRNITYAPLPFNHQFPKAERTGSSHCTILLNSPILLPPPPGMDTNFSAARNAVPGLYVVAEPRADTPEEKRIE